MLLQMAVFQFSLCLSSVPLYIYPTSSLSNPLSNVILVAPKRHLVLSLLQNQISRSIAVMEKLYAFLLWRRLLFLVPKMSPGTIIFFFSSCRKTTEKYEVKMSFLFPPFNLRMQKFLWKKSRKHTDCYPFRWHAGYWIRILRSQLFTA